MTDDWTLRAACADPEAGHDPEMWFPLPSDRFTTGLAKRICKFSCPVRDDCLTFALTVKAEYGVWGGLDEYERERLVRAPARAWPRTRNTRLPPAEEIRTLMEQGETRNQIAFKYGVSVDAVDRKLRRAIV